MTPLRKQMEGDMVVRGLAYRTRQTYIESVAKLARFYGKAPDRISEEEVQRYLLHLRVTESRAVVPAPSVAAGKTPPPAVSTLCASLRSCSSVTR